MTTHNHHSIDSSFALTDASGKSGYYLIEVSAFILMPAIVCQIVQDDGTAISVELGCIWSHPKPLGPFRYTDREADEHAGLQYNRARHYDPGVGRWLADDPTDFDEAADDLFPYPR